MEGDDLQLSERYSVKNLQPVTAMVASDNQVGKVPVHHTAVVAIGSLGRGMKTISPKPGHNVRKVAIIEAATL